MAASPFAPDATDMDAGGSVDPMTPAPEAPPMGGKGDVRSKRLDAALAALSALAMFAPIGKGGKGLAAALGIGGGLSLASGSAEAQKLRQMKEGVDTPAIRIASPGAQAAFSQNPPGVPGRSGEIQDEHSDRERAIRGQLDTWQKKLTTGLPKAETQQTVNDLNRQLKEISDARASKEATRVANEQAERKRTSDHTNAIASEESRNNYRMWGGGLGLGAGALVALLSRGKLNNAVGSFEKTAGDIGKLTSERGNLVVSKGNQAPELHAAVNTAYEAGGAKPPLPSMSGIYGSESQKGLREAKGEFRAANEKVPSNSPFSSDKPEGSTPAWMGLRGPSNAKKVSDLHPIVEKGIPLAAGAEMTGTLGASFATDNPDTKETLQNAAWMGGTALGGYGIARKLGSAFATAKPNEAAMRAVNAGRERLQKDAQTVGLKDLKTYSKQINDVSISNLPRAKGEFKPRDAAGMAELRNIKSTKGQARSDFTSSAHQNDQIVQAHAAAIDPASGLVDRNAFRKSLRQILNNQVMHKGQSIKIDNSFVNELLKAFGSR